MVESHKMVEGSPAIHKSGHVFENLTIVKEVHNHV